jgi:hypothetical protein
VDALPSPVMAAPAPTTAVVPEWSETTAPVSDGESHAGAITQAIADVEDAEPDGAQTSTSPLARYVGLDVAAAVSGVDNVAAAEEYGAEREAEAEVPGIQSSEPRPIEDATSGRVVDADLPATDATSWAPIGALPEVAPDWAPEPTIADDSAAAPPLQVAIQAPAVSESRFVSVLSAAQADAPARQHPQERRDAGGQDNNPPRAARLIPVITPEASSEPEHDKRPAFTVVRVVPIVTPRVPEVADAKQDTDLTLKAYVRPSAPISEAESGISGAVSAPSERMPDTNTAPDAFS